MAGGGFTLVAAPPSDPTASWVAGGVASGVDISTVQRITYATDTATATIRGSLNLARDRFAAAGNTTDGWFGGGYGLVATTSTVDRITYATDTATASIRGPLSAAGYSSAGTSGIQ